VSHAEERRCSDADHVFCDLEDAVAPSAKIDAREKIAWRSTISIGQETAVCGSTM